MQQSKDQCLEITETFEALVEEAENNSNQRRGITISNLIINMLNG